LRGSELREWRKALGHTQEEAAKALDVSRVTIQNWEREATKTPASVPLACRQLLRKWKQRSNFGPVTLIYSKSPLRPSTAAAAETGLTCERCADNQDAFRRLAAQKEAGAFNPFVVDEMGAVTWSGRELLQMCNLVEAECANVIPQL
jgi:DNA-binding XRE family transcriptional regulator